MPVYVHHLQLKDKTPFPPKPPKSLRPFINLKSYHDHSVHMCTMDRILRKRLSLAPPCRWDNDALQSMVPHQSTERWSRMLIALQIIVVYNFGKKVLIFLQVLHHHALILQEAQEWGFPTVSFLHTSEKRQFPATFCESHGGNNHGSFCATLTMTNTLVCAQRVIRASLLADYS